MLLDVYVRQILIPQNQMEQVSAIISNSSLSPEIQTEMAHTYTRIANERREKTTPKKTPSPPDSSAEVVDVLSRPQSILGNNLLFIAANRWCESSSWSEILFPS